MPRASSDFWALNFLASAVSRCGVGVGADRRRAGQAAAGDHEAAGHQLVADLLLHGVRLAGQQRLVDREPVRLERLAVDRDLVARVQLEHIVEHDLLAGHVLALAVADHRHLRRAHEREAIERRLGSPLLDDADEDVQHHHDPEQRVLRVAEHQDRAGQHGDDGVEPGEDVRPDDLADRARRAGVGRVGLALCHPAGDLTRGQPAGAARLASLMKAKR